MTPEEYVKEKLQDLGKAVDDQIPVNYGFVLLVFPFGSGGLMQYVANCGRADATQMMREWIAVTDEKTYGTDQEESPTGFDLWWAAQNKRWHEGNAVQSVKQWCYDAYVAGRAEV
jgi:hypothetical protein